MTPVIVAFLALLAAASAQTCHPPLTSTTRNGATRFVVDPWIVPSTNTTNGSLPPGACPFASYPTINATCRDSITFVTRAVPAGLRVHGTYLLHDYFVNQTTGAYRCPSTALEIDLRNGTGGGYANPGACRGLGITQVVIDGTPNMTAPFFSTPQCAGYDILDPLAVYIPTAPTNCSTPTVTVGPLLYGPSCYTESTYRVNLRNLVQRGAGTKYLVFSCPQISANQRMSLVVRVTGC